MTTWWKVGVILMVMMFVVVACMSAVDMRRTVPVMAPPDHPPQTAPIGGGQGGAGTPGAWQEEAMEGEASPEYEPPPSMEDQGYSPPNHHVWSYLKAYDSEPAGYAMYTYVLAARKVIEGQPAQVRLQALVEAVQASTTSDEMSRIALDHSNLFLIPGGDYYHYDLSLLVLQQFRITMSSLGKKLDRAGPYLVSVIYPASHVVEQTLMRRPVETPILIADLSNTSPAVMRDLVRMYKSRLSGPMLTQPVNEFKSLRLQLASILTTADDYLLLIGKHLKEIKG